MGIELLGMWLLCESLKTRDEREVSDDEIQKLQEVITDIIVFLEDKLKSSIEKWRFLLIETTG